MSKPKQIKSAAILTIKDASKMTSKGRCEIAEWLIKQSKDLMEYGDEYADTCRMRYLYADLSMKGGKNEM